MVPLILNVLYPFTVQQINSFSQYIYSTYYTSVLDNHCLILNPYWLVCYHCLSL